MDNVFTFIKLGVTALIVCVLIAASLRVLGVGVDLSNSVSGQLVDTLSNTEFMERYNGERVDSATAKEALERFAGLYPEVLYTNGNTIYELMVFTNNKYDSYLNPAKRYLVNVVKDGSDEVEIIEIAEEADEGSIGSYNLSKAKQFQDTWNNLKEMLEVEYKVSEYSKMISEYADLYAEFSAINNWDKYVPAGNESKLDVFEQHVPTDMMLKTLEESYEESVRNKLDKELSVKGGGN